MRRAPLFVHGLLVALLLGCGSETVDRGDGLAEKKRAPPSGQPAGATGATVCDPSDANMQNPLAGTLRVSCCREGNDEWNLLGGGGPGDGLLVHREMGPRCTLADGSVGCGVDGPTPCFYGPCGVRVVAVYDPPAHVFVPDSNPTVCGRQAGNLAGYPEEWTGTQPLYPGAGATCPYDACLAGGTAVIELFVDAVADGATGSVKSSPAGIAFSGEGSASAFYADPDVKLSARPHGPHARAVFDGACNKAGKYGEEVGCKLTLGPNNGVTVFYECRPGFTCL